MLEGVSEQAWIEVIQKMDEVYQDLLQYEVALEEKNAALEESHQFIASVLSSMSDILIVCDRNGHIEDVNASLLRLVGRSEQELKGSALVELFADESSRRQIGEFVAARQRAEIHDCDLDVTVADGSRIPVSLNCMPRLSASGKFLGMVITGRPVGELKKAYLALRQAHDDLKRTQQQLLQAEKMASLGRLVAGVAHELNNPISFVLGNVLALRRYADRLRAYLERVHSAGASAADLDALRRELRIDRLLADLPPLIEGMIEGAERTRDIVDGLKRFSARDQREQERFNLVDIVTRATRWVTRSGAQPLRVETNLPPELPVNGAPGQIQQVLMNIVQNAADATSAAAAPRLQIHGRQEGRQVVVEFLDNGPGIAEDIRARLFEPFFTTKPVGQGTGLGLSISYGIVERHGGRLEALNGPQGGALFRLILPAAC